MNALADEVQKQEVYAGMYTLYNMVTLFNNHPYISSSLVPRPSYLRGWEMKA